MDGPITISIPVDIQEYSVNSVSRESWQAIASSRKRAKANGRAEWLRAGAPKFDQRVRLDTHLIRGTGKLLDEFNILAALKGFIDGICCKGGLVPGDDPKWLKAGGVTQDSQKKYRGRECIHLTFTPIEPFDKKESLLWQK